MRSRISSLFLGRTQQDVKPQPEDEAQWQLDILPTPVIHSCPVLAPAPGLSCMGSELAAGADFSESSVPPCSPSFQLHWQKCISVLAA